MLQNPVHVATHLVPNKIVSLFFHFLISMAFAGSENFVNIMRYPHISQLEF